MRCANEMSGSSAGATFVRSLAGTPQGQLVAGDGGFEVRIETTITRLHAAATETWRPVTLELDVFAGHLATCVAAAPGRPDPLVAVAALHASDLYLACAAGHGLPHAREAFVRTFLSSIAGAVQGIERDETFVDEVRQALHERLLLKTDGPPRILSYGGRAPLGSWVAVAAQRLALGLLQSEGARRRAAERAGDEPLPVELDPELQYLKARYRDEFKAALTTAIARLPERERTVMRLNTVGGLTLARIGTMLGVDESTVSRWIQRARGTILAETQRELGERLGLRVADVPSVARLVTSQLDVSIARLLADG